MTTPQTWIWNWDWNCLDDSTGASSVVPADPGSSAGESWVWNWHWSCGSAGAPPPVWCDGCNISISVRILSPGDDGDLTQTIATTTSSIAQTVTSTIQQTSQEIQGALPVVLPEPPSALQAGDAQPAAPVPTDSVGEWASAVAAAIDGALLEQVADIAAISAGGRLVRGAVPDLAWPPPRRDRAFGMRPALVAPRFAAGAQLVPSARPAAAGGSMQRQSKSRAPRRAPAPPAPLGFGPDVSIGGAAHGSSASLSAFALLLCVLLVTAPGTARWLRVVVETRPHAHTSGQPERPG